MTCLVAFEARAEKAEDAENATPLGPQAAPAAEAPAPAASTPPRLAAEPSMTAHASRNMVGPHYRSPGLAIALSLTPVPVDFGNLYAENIAWGAVYSTAEIALMTPMMWLVGDHMSHGSDGNRTWSTGERGWAIGLVTGYVVVKIASGIHAGFAATTFNRKHEATALFAVPSVGAVPGGALLGMQRQF